MAARIGLQGRPHWSAVASAGLLFVALDDLGIVGRREARRRPFLAAPRRTNMRTYAVHSRVPTPSAAGPRLHFRLRNALGVAAEAKGKPCFQGLS